MATSILPLNSSNLNSHINKLNKDFLSSVDEYYTYEKGGLLNNKYLFVSNIQNGSFGKVTLAKDLTQSNRKVAIKSLKKSVPGITKMAYNEIKIMKRLGFHDNIVSLLDSFETKKFIILVLEYQPNGDLYDLIHNQTPLGLKLQNDPSYFIDMANQLSNVIKYSHSKGVYHRDIKPENILIDSNGNIKLCDWGLSTTNLYSKDFNLGTEKYMSPEALINDYEFNPLINEKIYNCQFSDYWSFGITLLFTLFGKCIFKKANLNTDLNFLNYFKSKSFLYDYYNNMSMVTFDSIILNCLNLNPFDRSLDKCMHILNNDGFKGLTIDQEFKYQFNNTNTTKNKSQASISNSNNNSSAELGGEFLNDFMFDDGEDYQLITGPSGVPSPDDVSDNVQPQFHNQQQQTHTSIKPITISSSIASRSDMIQNNDIYSYNYSYNQNHNNNNHNMINNSNNTMNMNNMSNGPYMNNSIPPSLINSVSSSSHHRESFSDSSYGNSAPNSVTMNMNFNTISQRRPSGGVHNKINFTMSSNNHQTHMPQPVLINPHPQQDMKLNTNNRPVNVNDVLNMDNMNDILFDGFKTSFSWIDDEESRMMQGPQKAVNVDASGLDDEINFVNFNQVNYNQVNYWT